MRSLPAALAQTKPFLEQHLREWMGRIANVEIIYEAGVRAPFLDNAGQRAAGVTFSRRAKIERLDADLVIDATGRNTRLPRWLEENGFGRAPESRMGIDLGYATGRFCVPKELLPDSPRLHIVGPPPEQSQSRRDLSG